MGLTVPYEIAERLEYLLRQLRDEGVVPEDYVEEVDEILTRWELWRDGK